MIITDKTSTEMRFGDLKVGDTFKLLGDIYMKTDCFSMNDLDIYVNAVNLCSGYLHSFPDDEIITPVSIEAIVTSKTEL